MRYLFIALLPFCINSCLQTADKIPVNPASPELNFSSGRSYLEIKDSIVMNRKRLSAKYSSLNRESGEITDFWIDNISIGLYSQWQNTPWDFNGTTEKPNEGAIACGYFVTTILRDMDLKINRNKLAVCASSIMMKTLAPQQKIKNLSYLNYAAFNDTLKKLGKGVYIIGLDFHTGFIVNDGKENWFIHSNYIKRKGVTKETVNNSAALRSSRTRWLISLTSDRDFVGHWLKG